MLTGVAKDDGFLREQRRYNRQGVSQGVIMISLFSWKTTATVTQRFIFRGEETGVEGEVIAPGSNLGLEQGL
ncbi:hypothetical protein J6590_022474 [Homalodisca vitripennis]|nr:hypothetical protein J6590_022474 [Homalodisca vitripennis]